jgi:uncharacterized repeat protein (TIGR02543 family)
MTYQLNWIKLNTVYFVRDGRVIQEIEVPMNTSLEGNPDVPVIPQKAGYKGVWMLDGEYFDLATPISEDKLTLVETYVQQYLVKFVNYDGSLLASDLYDKDEVPEYTGIPAREATAEFTYEFSGWTPEVVPVSADATYTATYTATKNKYPIKFINDDWSTLQNSEVEYGVRPEYTGETPTKAATETKVYEFKDWDPAVVDVVSGATYKATYTEKDRWYDVTFENAEGAVPDGQRVEYKDKATDPGAATTDKVGIQFVGWFEEGSETAFDFNTPITANKTLTAKWVPVLPEKVTVTFDSKGGSEVKAQEVVYGQKAVKPEDPTKDGFKFVEWYEQGKTVPFDFDTAITKDTVLEATWEEDVSNYARVSRNLLLGQNIFLNVNITIKSGTSADDYTINATYVNGEGKQTTYIGKLSEVATHQSGDMYRVVFPVAAKEMNNIVNVKVQYKGKAACEDRELSVRDYCEDAASRNPNEKTLNLLKAILDYGAYSQLYFKYDTNNLANKNLTSGLVESTAVPKTDKSESAPCTGLTKASSSLGLEAAFEMDTKFAPSGTASEADMANYTFKIDGAAAVPELKSGRYVVTLKDITAVALGDMHTFTATHKDGSVYTVNDSPIAYLYRAYSGSNDINLVHLCSAIYLYYQAAIAYSANA